MLVQIKAMLRKRRELTTLYKYYKWLRVVQWSPYENIYYCCTQKTASQWFTVLFSDPIVYKYTGLGVCQFNQILDRLQDTSFDTPLPRYTIGTNLYIDYSAYLTIPKPEKYRTFFILRDPRDIVVSWYFSVKYSHPPIAMIPEARNDLGELSLSEGLRYSIDSLKESGLFDAQRSWMDISQDLENIRIFRYEDFVRDDWSFLKQLFDYLDIEILEKELIKLYDRHKFEQYSGGRKKGLENPKSHFRKGIAGDWINYFDNSTMAYFKQVTNDLLQTLGYQE